MLTPGRPGDSRPEARRGSAHRHAGRTDVGIARGRTDIDRVHVETLRAGRARHRNPEAVVAADAIGNIDIRTWPTGQEPVDPLTIAVDRDVDRGVRLVRIEGPALQDNGAAVGDRTVQA